MPPCLYLRILYNICQTFCHYNIAVINFSDDNDGLPDSSGEYTKASLTRTKRDTPRNFTICVAYMIKVWNTDSTVVDLFTFNKLRTFPFSGQIRMRATDTYTQFEVSFGGIDFDVRNSDILFPLTWTRVCLSYDQAGRVDLVVNGEILKNETLLYLKGDFAILPSYLDIELGNGQHSSGSMLEYTGMISQLNIFSSRLSTERLVALTMEECSAAGDYVSWEDEDWKLHSHARIEMVGELEEPCRKESKVNVYTAVFKRHQDCMMHCQKLGQGRSPPLRTYEEWKWLMDEIYTITGHPDNPGYRSIANVWLAATDEELEGEWKDPYTGEIIDKHSRSFTTKGWDDKEGRDRNCLEYQTNNGDLLGWNELQCESPYQACPCQYRQQPLLLLKGLCRESMLDTQFTPKQKVIPPIDVILVGKRTTQIQYNDSSGQWILTDAVSSVTAVSEATKVSYVLGKHRWTVSNDVFSCNKGQPYSTLLMLSGCNPDGEFTCDDGQCITMEQRCNQIPNCRDDSDELGCQLLVVKDGYNMKIPPIVPTGGNDFNPTNVDISIRLLKIVSMEEVQHKIEFQFEIILEWKENRATYLNLKKKTSLNALTDAEINTLWLPYVIYANTDMKEAVQLENGLKTTIVVNRQGNFTRSGPEDMDEIELFEGKENKLIMSQTYTKSFQCPYNLQKYPFDTQVNEFYYILLSMNFLKVCTIEMTNQNLDLETVNLMAKQLWMEESKDLTLFVIKNWTLTTTESGRVKMTIVLKRKIMNEMMTTYLPSVLLMLITYATTFFKPYFFEAALSVNLTTMLVMTTIFMTVMQMLPATAYVKMIDIFLIFGQLYPFAEVVLLTVMEYQREGDGSGMEEPAPDSEEDKPDNPEEVQKKPEDKLFWYRFTGKLNFQ